MIQAGYWKPAVQMSRNLEKTVLALKSVFSPAQLEELIALLQQSD
jgi:hypothetical protein